MRWNEMNSFCPLARASSCENVINYKTIGHTMRLIWKVTMLAAVPLLALGQEAKDEDDEDAAPKAGASADGFAPYQTILDRMPFGPLPPNFNPDAPPGTATAGAGASGEEEVQLTEDEQQIVSSVRVSILNVTPSGAVAVGFTDSAAQPPANYYMKVGEKRDVWEVKEADPAEQTVVLVKNGVEATLKVGEGVAAGGDRKAKGAGVRPMQASSRMMMRAGGPRQRATCRRMLRRWNACARAGCGPLRI